MTTLRTNGVRSPCVQPPCVWPVGLALYLQNALERVHVQMRLRQRSELGVLGFELAICSSLSPSFSWWTTGITSFRRGAAGEVQVSTAVVPACGWRM